MLWVRCGSCSAVLSTNGKCRQNLRTRLVFKVAGGPHRLVRSMSLEDSATGSVTRNTRLKLGAELGSDRDPRRLYQGLNPPVRGTRAPNAIQQPSFRLSRAARPEPPLYHHGSQPSNLCREARASVTDDSISFLPCDSLVGQHEMQPIRVYRPRFFLSCGPLISRPTHLKNTNTAAPIKRRGTRA